MNKNAGEGEDAAQKQADEAGVAFDGIICDKLGLCGFSPGARCRRARQID